MPRKKQPPPSRGKPAKLAQNLEKTLLQYIEGKRYTPLTASELTFQLDIPEVHHPLVQKILKDLTDQKILGKEQDRYFACKHQVPLVTGTISVHAKGFGFVKVPEGPDVFIPKPFIRGAVDGDTVEIEVNPEISAKGPEGVVVSIVKRSRSHIAGTIIGKSGNDYHAYSPLMGPDKPVTVKTPKGMVLELGDRIICEITQWQNGNDLVEAIATQCMGNISDPSIDVTAAIEEFGLPHEFTKEAISEATAYGKKASSKELKLRRDLTHWETVTIDPDTAKDYDDAISLTTDAQGHFHLGVHIADVAHYVKPGMHLDREAFARCNSTYFPGTCVPMLPEELSNDLCSLKSGVIRLTQSVLAEFDSTGKLVHVDICRSAIKSKKRFTYKEALQVLLGKKKSVHAPLLERMTQLCALFKVQRMERGSIDFSMTEEVLIVDDQGVPQKLEKIEYDITHQMIEEFMLKANELVALELARRGKTLIYRVHEEPSADSFQDFYAFSRSLGFHLPQEPTPRDLQNMFKEAKDSPFLSQLSVSFIRSMRLACYSPENIGHYGLALEHYCHFTSPIRRYTDLIIQRLSFDELPEETNVAAIATACSEKERASFRAESSVTLLKKLRLAKTSFDEDPTQIYTAVITKVKPFALFFEVADFDLESSLHVSQIGSDFYEYNPQRMQFRGSRSGQIYTAGTPIQVRLDKVDLLLHQSQWSIVQSTETFRARKKRR